jgi:hypothetical protein
MTRRSLTDSQGRLVCASALRIQVCVMALSWNAVALLVSRNSSDRIRDPVLHERALSASIATRIATLWRRVLGDPRNYGKDPGIYLDTDQFTFHLSFLPSESITANMTGWGARTEQLTNHW